MYYIIKIFVTLSHASLSVAGYGDDDGDDGIFFEPLFKTEESLSCNVLLVSGVNHSDVIFLCIKK